LHGPNGFRAKRNGPAVQHLLNGTCDAAFGIDAIILHYDNTVECHIGGEAAIIGTVRSDGDAGRIG
jgi:hypothetical protein